MAVTSTLVVHFPSVLLLFHTVTYLITLFCLCLRSGQRQECNNEEIFRVSVVSHITRSHLSAVAAAQLCLYGQVYLMGWGSSAGGLGNMSAVGIFWIQQKFGQSKPLLVTPELLYFNTSVLQKSWKLLGECWSLYLELMNGHHCSCHSKGGRVALFPWTQVNSTSWAKRREKRCFLYHYMQVRSSPQSTESVNVAYNFPLSHLAFKSLNTS